MGEGGWCRPFGPSNQFVALTFLSLGLFLLRFMASHVPLEVLPVMAFEKMETGSESEYASLVFSAEANTYANIFATIVSGFLVFTLSPKMFFGTGITGSAVSTLLLPVALAKGRLYVLLVNIMKGLFEGMVFPPMLVLCEFWFPSVQMTTLMSIVIFGYYFGQVSHLVLWNHLSTEDSWTHYYYLTGAFGIVWAVLYFLLMREKPKNHSALQDYIIIDRFSEENRISVRNLPWKKMMSSKCTLLLIMLMVCRSLNVLLLNCTLMALHQEIDIATIVYTSFGCSASASVIIIFSGHACDYLRLKCHFSTTLVRKIFCGGALFGFGLVLPFIGLVSNNSSIRLAFFGIAVILEAILFLNVIVNMLDIAPLTSGLLFALCFGIGSIIAKIVLYVVHIIIVLNLSFSEKKFEASDVFTFENLQIFFIINIVINIVSGIFFAFLGSGEQQEFWEDDPIILIPQLSYEYHNDETIAQNEETNQNDDEDNVKYPINELDK